VLARGGRAALAAQAGGCSQAQVRSGAQLQQALLHMALVTPNPTSSWQGAGTPSRHYH